MNFLIINVFCLFMITLICATAPKPRGVPISKASFYQPGETFTCLDGSATIPFHQVNDDYCDCSDASDEPGTSACPTGTFHCTNAGHKPMNIAASWVNDGICDCCDGTDEFELLNPCENNCKELGKEAREEAEKQRKLLEEGHAIYLEYSKQGANARKEKLERREIIEKEKSDLQNQRDELEILKEEAEKPEKEAIEKHKQVWEEEKAQRQAQKELDSINNAFTELDVNSDDLVTISEIQNHPEFDIDSNGEVSLEESKEYLEDYDAVDRETFKDKIWPNIKEIYKIKVHEAATDETIPPPPTKIPPVPGEDEYPTDESGGEEYDEDHEEEEDMEEDDYEEARSPHRGDLDDMPDEEEEEDRYDETNYDEDDQPEEVAAEDDDDKMGEYDEETQKLIEIADMARQEFNDVDRKYKELEKEITDINKFLDLDLGKANEFYPLKGNCYEMTDSQYTYKLCPFDKATQRGKHGGAETNLGYWGKWDGPEDSRYSVQNYERGQNCWNGPDRSVKVKLECGSSNVLLSSSEPNRCEYEFKFSTPALCALQPKTDEKQPNDHDEL